MAQKYFVRSLETYLGFGECFEVESQPALEARSRSVESEGYAYRDGMYVWEPETVIHAHAPADFLFSSFHCRHSLAEVDGGAPDSIRVFTLGGSLAQGYFATSKGLTWHARLEDLLNATVDPAAARRPVRVYSCGMGGFVSTQERLALALAIVPRKPDIVVILNGANDLILPLSHGVRPGDPYLKSTLLKYWYERPTHDKSVSEATMEMLSERAARIFSSPRKRSNFFDSIVNVYTENMEHAAAMCGQLGCPLHIFFQPWRDKSREIGGIVPDRYDFSPEMRLFLSEVHLAIVERMRRSHPNGFYDLSQLFSSADQISVYTDTVHVDDDGHRILAEAIFPPVERSCREALRLSQPC